MLIKWRHKDNRPLMQTGHFRHEEGEVAEEEVNFYKRKYVSIMLIVCFKNIFCVKSMNISRFHSVYLGTTSADDAEFLM